MFKILEKTEAGVYELGLDLSEMTHYTKTPR